jgi:hypothetical protein
MIRRLCLIAVVALVCVHLSWPGRAEVPAGSAPSGGREAASRPAEGITESIYRGALAWLDKAGEKVDEMVPAAEEAAERLAAGGTLYAAGNGGFADELETRAGGFPFTQRWSGQRLGSDDVVLVGRYRPHEMDDRFARPTSIARGYGRRFGRGMLVHFASHRWPEVARVVPMVDRRHWGNRLHLFDTGTPPGAAPADLCLGQLATTALAWAFHGEVIAAATRKGKMLATYASDWEPNGRAWDATVRDEHVHPKYTVPPIQAGTLGKKYLKICRDQIAAFLSSGQADQVRLAAGRMARCLNDGRAVWITCDGHVHPRGSLVPAGLAGVILQGRSYDWGFAASRLPGGDMLLYMGYLRYPRRSVDQALGRGVDVVTVSVDPGPTNDHLTHILGCWKDWDTVIDLPKYPIRVLPSSGVVQTPQWYALMAETLVARLPTPQAGPPARQAGKAEP